MTTAPKRRLDFLDNLRGLAALYVLVFHVYRAPQPNLTPPDELAAFLMHGGSGVVLFFVISAFSLCLTMPRHISTGQPALSFATSRYFRIAPLFYVLVVHGVITAYLLYGWLPIPGLILSQAVFVFNLIPGWARSNVAGGWTVGTEMLFYAAFPVLYFLLKSWRQRTVLFVASIAVAYYFAAYGGSMFGSDAIFEHYRVTSIVMHFPTFVLGMLVFDAYTAWRSAPQAGLIGNSFMAVGVVLLASQIAGFVSFGWLQPTHISGLSYAAILLGAALSTPKVLTSRVLSFYGRISYSLYLWHIPVIVLLTPTLQSVYRIDMSDWIRFPIVTSIVLSISTLLAYLSYRWIEMPGEAWGKRVFTMLSERAAASPKGA